MGTEMKRRQMISVVALMLMTSLLQARQTQRPNIIFLFTDDQNTYSLGCYGNEDVVTPNIDSLARDGVTFDRHYTVTAICMASRATVMTGMYEYRHGCNFGHGPLHQQHWEQSYPMLLRKQGYLTAIAGKIGFEVLPDGEEKPILPEGDFDWWGAGPGQTSYRTRQNKSMAKYADEFPHSSRSYGAFGRDFIHHAAKEKKPFCLSISFKAPHKPDQVDPMFDQVYANKTFKKPANYGREFSLQFSRQSKTGRQYERFESWGYKDDYDNQMRLYNQLVHAVDSAVGMIRAAVDEAGVADNTVIIFTSDNGFFCGAHGYGSKVLPYEEGSRVPLIIFDPRHENSGQQLRVESITGSIDFAPTILGLAGVKSPRGMDGRNLMPLYDDPGKKIHQYLELINVWGPRSCQSFGVVGQDYKYIYWPYETGDYEATQELFKISEDPLELQNLVLSGAVTKELKQIQNVYDARVRKWRAQSVPYNDYQPYGQIFDRSIPWAPSFAPGEPVWK
tara:strand:- start:11589 stop:13100 length:1512 start_codon:yes stop_codon:yes gene_type:complete